MEPITAICRDEVLRYLGYRGQPLSDDFLRELGECESLLLSHVRPTYVSRVFDCMDTESGISLLGSTLFLTGDDIKAHLNGCRKVILFAATLSFEADQFIARMSKTSVSRGLMLDAAADALIEQVCDAAEQEMLAGASEMHATRRFSPGYGDLPLSLQREILTILDAQRRIGLCATDTNILTPRKSVTAVIGLSEKAVSSKKQTCQSCAMRAHCAYRKRGDRCDRA